MMRIGTRLKTFGRALSEVDARKPKVSWESLTNENGMHDGFVRRPG